MANLKVTSKKYNDKDVLEVNDTDFNSAVQAGIDSGAVKPVKALNDANFQELAESQELMQALYDEINIGDTIYLAGVILAGTSYEYSFVCTAKENNYFYLECQASIELDNVEYSGCFVSFQKNPEGDWEATSDYNFNLSGAVANPTLAGSESALTGLKVGPNKYKVSGGTKLYLHTLEVVLDNGDTLEIGVINTSPLAFIDGCDLGPQDCIKLYETDDTTQALLLAITLGIGEQPTISNYNGIDVGGQHNVVSFSDTVTEL